MVCIHTILPEILHFVRFLATSEMAGKLQKSIIPLLCLSFQWVFCLFFTHLFSYLVDDVLCRQQIKPFQVVSTSEFHEYCWNNIDFNFLVPLTQTCLNLVQGLRSKNIKLAITTLLFLSLEKTSGLFSIIKMRLIIISNKNIEIEICSDHEVLKMYFQRSKN